MAQLSLYLDPETHRKVEAAARRESVSLSRWAREHLAKAADASAVSAWDHLAGFSGTSDDSFAVPTRDVIHREIPSLES